MRRRRLSAGAGVRTFTRTFLASTRDSAMWLRRPRCGEPEMRLSQAEVEALIATYDQRKSIKELAQWYEVDGSGVGHP